MAILRHPQNSTQRFDYLASALLVVAMVPLLRHLNLPLRFDWMRLVSAYWLVLAAQAIFVATLLFVVGTARVESVGPLLQRVRRDPLRILVVLIFFGTLLWALTWIKALILTVDAMAALELWERTKPEERWRKVREVLLPALYLFVGFLLVFAYNDIILSLRFFAAADAVFNSVDQWILRGASVPQLCHWALSVFPVSFFHFLDFIYYGMFAQVGAALLLSCLRSGKGRGLQFVGAILTAYYAALVLFYCWPSQGPYYLCAIHFAQFPQSLQTYAIQKQSIVNSQALWNHIPISRISTDYYIAFPCMHMAQPLIVLWFLRHWKRAVLILAAYDVLLLAAIVFLEWHYVVDILASAPVAGFAIAVIDGRAFWRWLTRRGTEPESANT